MIGLPIKEDAAMKKSDRRPGQEQKGREQLRLPLRELVREALFDTVIVSGLGLVGEVLEEERTALCGPRYQHDPQRDAVRAGSVTSSLTLGGRRVEVERLRARSIDGRELSLPSWGAWSARDPLEQRAIEQMLVGVSTRRYARSLEPLPSELKVRGIGKSVVSDRFVVGTARRLAALMQRRLGGLQLIAVMIDGVRFADHVVLAAIGIDTGGEKHVLGLREGATENVAACKALLADLIERGLPSERTLLFVIDGAKALYKAITDIFGERALIQRCREHKKRNVIDALPERMRSSVRSAMSQAYATRDHKRAARMLEKLARRLEPDHPGAAASLREGLEETLTLIRLDLPESLERVLSSTNLIENLFSRVRDLARRVKRWQGGTMILRWTATGALEAEKSFRRIAGYRGLPKLVAALRAHDAQIDRRLDNGRRAA
jgi:transposase-like protein